MVADPGETAGAGMVLFLSRKLVFNCFGLFGDVLATYCVRRQCSFSSGLGSRNCRRPLIVLVAIDTEILVKTSGLTIFGRWEMNSELPFPLEPSFGMLAQGCVFSR